jgi:hypothetical protein
MPTINRPQAFDGDSSDADVSEDEEDYEYVYEEDDATRSLLMLV